jgi:hypothetical protein
MCRSKQLSVHACDELGAGIQNVEQLSNIILAVLPYLLATVMVVGFFLMLRRGRSKGQSTTGQEARSRNYGQQITIVRQDQFRPEVIRATPVVHLVALDNEPFIHERQTVMYDARAAHEQLVLDVMDDLYESSDLAPVVDNAMVVQELPPAQRVGRPRATASDLNFPPAVHPLVELPRHPVVQEFRVRLGLDRKAGVSLYLPAGHALIARDTGGGKTNIVLNVVSHYIKWGWRVWYGNPKFVPVDDDGLDMRPFADRCERVAVKIKDDMGKTILAMLEEAMVFVLDRVTESQDTGAPIGIPLVIVVEELKALMALWRKLEFDAKKCEQKPRDPRYRYARGCEDAIQRGKQAMEIILTLGRQLKVFLIVSAQDCQVQNIGLNQGSQGNFQWVIAHPDLDGQSLKNAFGCRDEELAELTTGIADGHDWLTMYKVNNRKQMSVYNSERVTNDWLLSMLQEVPVVDRTPLIESPSPEKETEETKKGRYTLVKQVEPVAGEEAAQEVARQRAIQAQQEHLTTLAATGQAVEEAPRIIQPGSQPQNMDEMIRVALAVGRLMGQGVPADKISQQKVAAEMRGGKATGRHVTDLKEPLTLIRPLLEMARDPEQPDQDTKLAV